MMKKILFVCVENAGRSQMAEAFFRKYIPAGFDAISAGTNPAPKVNSVVVDAMKEIGIDITDNATQHISQQMIDGAEISVNMGCIDKESCPALFLKNVVDWQIQDPKGKSINEVREIRDKIEHKVKEFVLELEQS